VRGVSEKTEEMAEEWWFPSRDKIIYQIDVFCCFGGKQQSFLRVWHGKLPILSSPPPFILHSTFHTNHSNYDLVAMRTRLRNKVLLEA
jgi:hypothetical protein